MELRERKIICHIDMDCFYVSVERARNPDLFGRPLAVVQYNPFEQNGVITRSPDEPSRTMWPPGPGDEYCPQRSALPPCDSLNGSMIAVSYEARAKGVKRGKMRAGEARKICPDLVLVQVPTAYGKADLGIYKKAGEDVVDVLCEFASKCEKKSVDEVALDITLESDRVIHNCGGKEKFLNSAEAQQVLHGSLCGTPDDRRVTASHIEGVDKDVLENIRKLPSCYLSNDEARLVAGALVVRKMRQAVFTRLQYSCSGGIAFNKLMAKLCCGLHKPNQQTVLLPQGVANLLHDLPIVKLTGLGGKLGEAICTSFNISTVGELSQIPFRELVSEFGESNAKWLHELSKGEAEDVVRDRRVTKELGSSKTFQGNRMLKTLSQVEYYMNCLLQELWQRAIDHRERHNEVPTTLRVGLSNGTRQPGFTRTHGGRQEVVDFMKMKEVGELLQSGMRLFKRWCKETDTKTLSVTGLGASLCNMVHVDQSNLKITSFFQQGLERPIPKSNQQPKSSRRTHPKRMDIADLLNCSAGAEKNPTMKMKPKESKTYEWGTGDKQDVSLCSSDSDSPRRTKWPSSTTDSYVNNDSVEIDSDCEVEIISICSPPEKSNSPTKPKRRRTGNTFQGIDFNDVDPNVLSELPTHVAEEIRREIRDRGSTTDTARSGIQRFFQRKNI